MNASGRMQIGEVAERIGLSLRTIRHYEEVGLAVPSARSEGGFRLYAESDVERLRVIMQMKPLGFSLEEMRELLELLDAGDAADPARLAGFREQAAERVVIDLSTAHVWDASSVAVLDAIEHKYATRGKTVEITGLTDVTGHYHQRLAGQLGGGE